MSKSRAMRILHGLRNWQMTHITMGYGQMRENIIRNLQKYMMWIMKALSDVFLQRQNQILLTQALRLFWRLFAITERIL